MSKTEIIHALEAALESILSVTLDDQMSEMSCALEEKIMELLAEEVAIMLCKTCDKEWFIRESDLISDDVACSDCGEDERLKREWM